MSDKVTSFYYLLTATITSGVSYLFYRYYSDYKQQAQLLDSMDDLTVEGEIERVNNE